VPLINYYKQGTVGPYQPSGEPTWSLVLGGLYALSLYIPSFSLWWGTGSVHLFLIVFAGTFVFTLFTTLNIFYQVGRFLYRKLRRVKRPAILWME
jgi:hypothetical protein